MKRIVAVVMLAVLITGAYAQKVNSKGLYIDENDQLFSGTISSINNAVKSELTVVNGEINGVAKYYDLSGKLIESGTFLNGVKNDKWIRYNSTGSISAIAFYNLGKKHGTWIVYDDAGLKRMEMIYENGEKVGTWNTFDEAGAVVSSKNYATSSN